MDHLTDKLFKQKLENQSRPAPANAWLRIETGLPKKKHKNTWLYAAAAVLLLATSSATVYWLLTQQAPLHPALSGNETPVTTPQSPVHNQPAEATAEEKHPATNRQAIPHAAPSAQEQEEAPHQHIATATEQTLHNATPSVETPVHDTEVQLPPVVPEPIETTQIALSKVQQTEEPQETVAANNSFKLVISATEANHKYLDKKSLAQATNAPQKTSGLKKVLTKASELKNNQSLFSELRQKKNELLAFNLQGSKKHESNK